MPALDGVRAVAVLMVLLFHYEVRRWAWSGLLGHRFKYLIDYGWTGVDLFFVLSGFLITGILWDTRERSRYYINFYARRTLRIFPLYYAFLLLIFVVLPLVAGGTALAQSTPFSTQIWYWGYASNLLVAFFGWKAAALYTPHFWSLAVEEQFYLVWPAVVRRISRRTAMLLCGAAIIAALILRCWLLLDRGNARAAWVLTPARMDALAVGALIALLARGPKGLERFTRRSRLLLVAGLAGVCGLLLWRGTYALSDAGVGTIGYTIVALGWGTLLIAALSGGLVTHLLSNRALVWIGRRSYAMYVFHYPILVMLGRAGLGIELLERHVGSLIAAHLAFLAVNLGCTLVAAELSWRALESPFLRLKKRFA